MRFGMMGAATILLAAFAGMAFGETGSRGPSPFTKSLSSEQLERLQVELFNELLVRGEATEMMGDGTPSSIGHYRRVSTMADEGFEPAAIALRIFDLEHGDLTREDSSALGRLTVLADTGDPTAKCLYATFYRGKSHSDDKRQKINRYIREAAKEGVPACMTYFSVAATESESAELYWKIQAAKRGDLLAQVVLVGMYARGSKVEKDLERAVCWLEQSERSNTAFANQKRRALRDRIADVRPDSAFCAEVVQGN